ncbi:extracellular solute-binding protein [Alicyclobacillus vulcanalis]|uniref:Iron(III) transport system substrate-binding protein n=1 Tax=Alicyclobacillus vulcanalis TaxID=252246 RepID=A0A1N7MBN1_9BACL|nr:extracellular solute-binding protein [Alicyclobacillus vulcanalis]SIS83473.1 iron(III) transport system substrate-binding protein [Alicyclobacillus vulcanalis]
MLKGLGIGAAAVAVAAGAALWHAASHPHAPAQSEASAVAAKPAGTLTVYAALTQQNAQAIAQAFEAYDPAARVQMVTTGTGALVTRLESEAKAHAIGADIVLLADPTAADALAAQGILSREKPSGASRVPSADQGADWVGAYAFHDVIVYHKGMSLPVPRSWQDLTRAAYKGEVEIGDPSYSGTTMAFVGMMEARYGWKYFETLKQNGAQVQSSVKTVADDVATGKVDVGMTNDSAAFTLVKQGSPIGVVWPQDGAIVVPGPMAFVKGHETPVAQAFANWLLSPAGQKVVASLGLSPIVGASPTVPKGAALAQVPWSKLERERADILREFAQMFR